MEHGACGLVVADRERALCTVGDVAAVVNCRSIRKSLLNAVVGRAATRGQLDLGSTLDELGIDDFVGPTLTPSERGCQRARHDRHPGTWEKPVRRVCRVDRAACGHAGLRSLAAAVCPPALFGTRDVFVGSTRDLARLGQLYLREGNWNGREILPARSVGETTAVHAVTPSGPGYGYLWWVARNGQLFAGTTMPDGTFAAYGMGGQVLLVIPAIDRVIALLADPERTQQGSKYDRSHRRRLAQLVHYATEGACLESGVQPNPRG